VAVGLPPRDSPFACRGSNRRLRFSYFPLKFIVRAIIVYVRKLTVLDEEESVEFLSEEYPKKILLKILLV